MSQKELIDFDKLRFPCMGEYLLDKDKGIWEKCLVHGFFTRGSAATPNLSLEGYWGVTDLFGENKQIYGWTNVRFSILGYSA